MTGGVDPSVREACHEMYQQCSDAAKNKESANFPPFDVLLGKVVAKMPKLSEYTVTYEQLESVEQPLPSATPPEGSPLTSPRVTDVKQELKDQINVETELEDLDVELNALLDLANRAINEEIAKQKGDSNASPFSPSQLDALKQFFHSAINQCKTVQSHATACGANNEFLRACDYETRYEDALNQFQKYFPEKSVVESQESSESQRARMWERLDNYHSLAEKGIGSIGVLEKRLSEAERIMAKSMEGMKEPEGEWKEKFTGASNLLREIKQEFEPLKNTLSELACIAGPWAVDELTERVDARLDSVERLTNRSDDLRNKASQSEHFQSISSNLQNVRKNYAKAVLDLIEMEQKVGGDAKELKNIEKKYETLNTNFSKELDHVESELRDIEEKEAAAKRTAEAKERIKMMESAPQGSVRKMTQTGTKVFKHIQQQAMGQTPSKGLRRTPGPTPGRTLEPSKDVLQTIEPSKITPEQKKALHNDLLKRIRERQDKREKPKVPPDDLKAFREKAHEWAQARRSEIKKQRL